MGFIFVPLHDAGAWPPSGTERLANATAAYNVVRNIGGSVGVALATTLLARRSQYHQAHAGRPRHDLGPGDGRAAGPAGPSHFLAQGADSFTAQRRAMAMLYRETVAQAQVLAYADDFWLLSIMFFACCC